MPLMKISEFRRRFSPDSRPDPRTVWSWWERGEIYGERIGKNLFVDPDRDPDAGNMKLSPLAEKVLSSGG